MIAATTAHGPGASDAPGARNDCVRRVLESWTQAQSVFGSRAVLEWYRVRTQWTIKDTAERALLSQVVRHGPIRLTDLSSALGTTLSSTSRVAQRLVGDGLIRRQRPESDRRVTLLFATSEGIEVHRRMIETDLMLVGHHLAAFSDDEVAAFADLIDRFAGRVTDWRDRGLELRPEDERTACAEPPNTRGISIEC